MPALKVRIPHVDRETLAPGVFSQSVKARLVELLAQVPSAEACLPPPPSLPAEHVGLWASDEQFAACEALAQATGLDGAGAAASGLLHFEARKRAAANEVAIATPIAPASPADADAPNAAKDDASELGDAPPDADDADEASERAPAARVRKRRQAAATKPPIADRAVSPDTPGGAVHVGPAMLARDVHERLNQINAALGDATRPDQAVFYEQLASEVLGRRGTHEVVLAEAATGIGKSRAFEALACAWCDHVKEGAVVIAAPSYGVLLQSIRQWQRIAQRIEVPAWGVIVGQQEFVSAVALEHVLAEHPDTPGAEAARAWLAAGGPHAEDDPIGHRWLMRSLREATAGLWQLESQAQLDSDSSDEDPGMLAYRGQFADAKGLRVLFCTHAMVATEVKRILITASKAFAEEEGEDIGTAAWSRWSGLDAEGRAGRRLHELRNDVLKASVSVGEHRLPPISLLIVDEAHLLEQSFASIFSAGIAVSRLMKTLRGLRDAARSAVRPEDMAKLERVWDDLKDLGGRLDGNEAKATDLPAVRAAAMAVREVVVGVLARAPKKAMQRPEVRSLRGIRAALDTAVAAAGSSSGLSLRVSWSPSVHWPSIQVGRYDVSRELDFLWSAVCSRSVLVSATLWDEVSLRAGYENSQRTLSIRHARLRPLPPVRPAWLYDPVTLMLAGDRRHDDGIPRFRRPTVRDNLSATEFSARAERWRDDVSAYLFESYQSAAGGVLALLTAYDESSELAARLASVLPAEVIVAQGPEFNVEAAKHRYLELVRDGARPLMLGVGAAWTGLDLSADAFGALSGQRIAPADDRVLTDLVIPTIPIGLNRSLTHEYRFTKFGMYVELGSLAMMMRQGIGRLVRGPGLPPNRRLHVLDHRLHEPEWNSMLHPIGRILAPYHRRKEV